MRVGHVLALLLCLLPLVVLAVLLIPSAPARAELSETEQLDLLERAEAYYRLEDRDNATSVALFEEVLAKVDLHPDVRREIEYNVACMHVFQIPRGQEDLRDEQKGLELFERFVARYPADRTDVLHALGQIGACYERLGRPEDAAAAHLARRKAIDELPEEARRGHEDAIAAMDWISLGALVNEAACAGPEEGIPWLERLITENPDDAALVATAVSLIARMEEAADLVASCRAKENEEDAVKELERLSASVAAVGPPSLETPSDEALWPLILGFEALRALEELRPGASDRLLGMHGKPRRRREEGRHAMSRGGRSLWERGVPAIDRAGVGGGAPEDVRQRRSGVIYDFSDEETDEKPGHRTPTWKIQSLLRTPYDIPSYMEIEYPVQRADPKRLLTIPDLTVRRNQSLAYTLDLIRRNSGGLFQWELLAGQAAVYPAAPEGAISYPETRLDFSAERVSTWEALKRLNILVNRTRSGGPGYQTTGWRVAPPEWFTADLISVSATDATVREILCRIMAAAPGRMSLLYTHSEGRPDDCDRLSVRFLDERSGGPRSRLTPMPEAQRAFWEAEIAEIRASRSPNDGSA